MHKNPKITFSWSGTPSNQIYKLSLKGSWLALELDKEISSKL